MSDFENKQDIDYVLLEELTDKDWLEVKALAVKEYDKGYYKGDMGKCYIAAFLSWIDHNAKQIAVNVDDFKQVH